MRASGYARADSDWYVEPRSCVDGLLSREQFTGTVWDPACGGGNIPEACKAFGLNAVGSDIADRGYGKTGVDFLRTDWPLRVASIISNPPFSQMQQWVDVALTRTTDRVAVLGRLAFLEGQKRANWFPSVPFARIYVLSKRISMPPGGTDIKATGGTVAFAWFVFQHGYRGEPVIRGIV